MNHYSFLFLFHTALYCTLPLWLSMMYASSGLISSGLIWSHLIWSHLIWSHHASSQGGTLSGMQLDVRTTSSHLDLDGHSSRLATYDAFEVQLSHR